MVDGKNVYLIYMDNVISETPDLSYDSSIESGSMMPRSSMLQYFIILLILAFLGFNLFTHLGEIIQWFIHLIKPILAFFGYELAETTKGVVNVSAKGTKGLIDVTAGTVTGSINILEKGLSSSGKDKKYKNKKLHKNNSLMNAIDNSVRNQPMPDDAGSKTQMSKIHNKAGYCYIGEDRGFRACIKVGEADKCMSGDIFPSHEICINPNLRD